MNSTFIAPIPPARLQKDPWWPTHHERDLYISLLQQTDPPAPDHVLKAALLRRAVTDITRIHSMREDKQAATVLVQKGSVGDDLLTRLLAAEKELETELLEVVGEANSFKEGWGSLIFQTASEMLANEKTRELYSSLPQLKAQMGWYCSPVLTTMLIIISALKYGKKKKRTQVIDLSASPTPYPSRSVEVPTAPSGTASSKLAPPTPPNNVITAGSDADDSPASTRTSVCRIFYVLFSNPISPRIREERKQRNGNKQFAEQIPILVCRNSASYLIIQCFAVQFTITFIRAVK